MLRVILFLLLQFCLGNEHHADTAGGIPIPLPALLDTTDANDLLIVHSEATIRIPYAKIRSLSYSKAAEPADPLDSAKPLRGNFHRLLTIGYRESSGVSHNLVIQIPQEEERSMLLDLEEQTGVKMGFEPMTKPITKTGLAEWSRAAIEIPEGTRISCRLERTISAASDIGQAVQLSVTEDVKINGAVAIPRGSAVSGMAVQIRGQLDLSIDKVRAADGSDIPLRYSHAGGGPKETGAVKGGAAVAFWPSAPFVLLRQSGNITVPRGIIFEVFTARDHVTVPEPGGF